jgi:hypothetical protein
MPRFNIITDKRVCFWGAPADTPPGKADLATKLQQTGHNAGNLMIGHGLFHATQAPVKTYHPGFGVMSPREFDEHFDVLFIPSSNFVRNGLDMEAQYAYFSATKAQFFVFGLGSQVRSGEAVDLLPGTDKFLRLAAERSGSLGVRGAGTAELLLSLGIRNVDITGCPSLMSFPSSFKSLHIGPIGPQTRIATNYSNNVRSHSFSDTALRSVENALFKRLMKDNTFYVLQNEAPELEIINAREHNSIGDSPAVGPALDRIAKLFEVDISDPKVRHFIVANTRIFFHVEEWVSCMRTMDFSIGTRFHGNIAALLAGVPALFLAHDNRTLELCEFFSLPCLRIDEGSEEYSLEEMLEVADYERFFARFHMVHAQWKVFLARNGLDFRSSLSEPRPVVEELVDAK